MDVVEERPAQRGRGSPGRGGGGRGRGRERGPAFTLENPMYMKRKRVEFAPRPQREDRGGGGRGGGGRGAPSRDRQAPSGQTSAKEGFEIFKDDDTKSDRAPAADFDSGPSKAPARRFNDKPDKKKGGSWGGAPKANDDEGGPRNKAARGNKRGGRRGQRVELTESEATAMARNPRKKGKAGKRLAKSPEPVVQLGPPEVTLSDTITVGELAKALRVGAAEVVKDLMRMGVLASITQSIDADTAEKIATGYDAIITRGGAGDEAEIESGGLGVVEEDDDASKLTTRPPVVTIMGHVDHGKTSLLDAMRTANVASGEAGGITQHIGAYSVPTPKDDGSTVTFIDTPGHAAFDDMRARGANVTDIVILAVAADDGVMAQTVQSIKAAKAAEVPIIVALTKSDKPNADAAKVKLQLLEQEVILEEFGGDVLSAPVSAKTGDGLDSLFEHIDNQAEILDLKANPDRSALGTVIEAKQVVGQGAVATVLVQRGTLKVGDIVVAGAQWGRVRTLSDDGGAKQEEAGPSSAVELVGLSGLPEAGDAFTVTPDDQKARELAETRQRLQRERRSSALFATRSQSQQDLFLSGVQGLPTKLLDFVVKADVQGSAEALSSALAELEAADDKLQVQTRVLRSGAGAITNEDIMLASVSDATVIGFNTAASPQSKSQAQTVGVDIREYTVVYDALDDVKAMMAALIRPPPSKQLGDLVGTLDVQQIFKIGAVGKVAGCRVLTGYIKVGCNIRILRGNIIVYEGKLQSLRQNKDMIEMVEAPDECGMSFDDYQGMEPEDRVEAYAAREVADDDDE